MLASGTGLTRYPAEEPSENHLGPWRIDILKHIHHRGFVHE